MCDTTCVLGDTPVPEGQYHHRKDRPAVLALIGGDARQLAAAEALIEAGYEVRIMGLGEAEDGGLTPKASQSLPHKVRIYHRTDRLLEGCLGIILPYPASKDGKTVFCPLDTQHSIALAEIGAYVKKHPAVRLFGGRMPVSWVEELKKEACLVTEYEDSEAFLIKNARLTAEGALMTAMELTDTSLLHASMAVLGYGRIGKLLARLLLAVGADVTVFARRRESLAEAEADGCLVHAISEAHRLTEGFEVIFNTVPSVIMSREVLTTLPCRTKIIELASSPGGLDPEGVTEATRRCGLQVIRAPALPGRYAPIDAGYAIADLIISALREEVKL